MVAALDHPSIIPIYDAGEEDGIVYIAMRHVGGGDLQGLIAPGAARSSNVRSRSSSRWRARSTRRTRTSSSTAT